MQKVHFKDEMRQNAVFNAAKFGQPKMAVEAELTKAEMDNNDEDSESSLVHTRIRLEKQYF